MAGAMKQRFLVALCALPLCAAAWAQPPSEYAVKAAFIHNIAKYVEWPGDAPAGARAKLCLLGQDPLDGALAVLQGKPIGNLTWEIVSAAAPAPLNACRVLFIAASESANLPQILASVRGAAVLTVGDTRGYAERGVMVNFYMQEHKVRFEINREAARREKFGISSQLLKLARSVRGAEPAGPP